MTRAIMLLVLLSGLPLAAGDLPVSEVVVFKNGIGVLTRAGDVTFRDGKGTIDRLPAAAYGGMWVSAEDGESGIEGAIARVSLRTVSQQAVSVADLLDANDGLSVTLRFSDRELSGILRSKPESSFGMIENGKVTTAFVKNDVRSVTADSGLVTTRKVDEPASVLELQSGVSNGPRPVSLVTMERGIGWTPEYEVQLADDDRAVVSLRAVLINDAADLEGTTVSFAVGYPSFEFAEVRTPMDPKQTLAQFLQSLSMGGSRRGAGPLANVMTQSVSVSGLVASSVEELPDSLAEGERHQDLYLYRKDRVSLKSGERGSYSLMRATVPYSHTWDWTIGDRPRVSVYGYEESRPPDEVRDQVWHSVQLENRADAPWTTGPALVFDRDRPIAQNTLHYTPSGATTRVRLTVATDIVADHDEIEKSRVAEPMRKFGHTYEGLDYEGTLEITNHRSEKVTVDVSRTLTGSVIKTGEGGSAVRLADEPSAVNPRSRIDWSVPVGSGETKSIKYLFRVWVRR